MVIGRDIKFDGTRKQRLIIHAGTSKTGSTSLQTYLDQHRLVLKSKGFLYPSVGVRDGWMPKHQWLVNTIINEDRREFDHRLRAVLDERDASTHTIILSTEGIANHWWDFSPVGLNMLGSLTRVFDVSCWIWFREPNAFFKSYYLQIIKNARHPRFEAYGRDRSPLQMLNTPWVARHLDYGGLLEGMRQVFGEDRVYPFAYTADIVVDFLGLLPLPLSYEIPLKTNKTDITSLELELLRIINRFPINIGERQAALNLAAQLSALLNSGSDAFDLGLEEKARIAELNESTAETLSIMSENSLMRWKNLGEFVPG